MAARGKTIALSSAGLGVLVLLGSAVVLWERLLEDWYIGDLRTGSEEEARRAAEALGRMGSVRAVPALLGVPGRKDLQGPGKSALTREVHQLGDIIGGATGPDQALPFPAMRRSDWETALEAILEAAGSREDRIFRSSPSGPIVVSRGEDSRAGDVLRILRWASAAIARIGERAVPALERAASDEKLDPGARAFARFELARRDLITPHIILPEGSAEISVGTSRSTPLPGSSGSVCLSAEDDAARGVMKVWVTTSSGAPIVEERLLAKGEEVSFSVGGQAYVLRLEELETTGWGVFRLHERRE
jgi:hypothetical protein